MNHLGILGLICVLCITNSATRSAYRTQSYRRALDFESAHGTLSDVPLQQLVVTLDQLLTYFEQNPELTVDCLFGLRIGQCKYSITIHIYIALLFCIV